MDVSIKLDLTSTIGSPSKLLVDLRYVANQSSFAFSCSAASPDAAAVSSLIAHSCREGKRRADRERAEAFCAFLCRVSTVCFSELVGLMIS